MPNNAVQFKRRRRTKPGLMQIRKVDNGYVAEGEGSETIFSTLDDLLKHMLYGFEGRGASFAGESYGIVRVIRHT